MTKFIGIDPDVDKSGFAVWDSEKQNFDLISQFSFFGIVDFIESCIPSEIVVVVEAGWLNKKSNYHGKAGQSKYVGEKIAKAVGSNHQVGKLFCELCVNNDVQHIEVKPTKKKLNSDEFKRLTGYGLRTNSENRDAAMLVFGR